MNSAAANNHERQRIVKAGECDRPDTELETPAAGLVSLLFDDGFEIKHRIALGGLQAVESVALRDQIPTFAQADEESMFSFYQGKKQFVPVAAPIHDPDPFSLGRLADRSRYVLRLISRNKIT